jgi:hypothetical protein
MHWFFTLATENYEWHAGMLVFDGHGEGAYKSRWLVQK